MSPDALAAEWRSRAAELRRYGAEPQAVTLEAAAAELDAVLAEAADAELTLAEAAAESGYSDRRLRELLADGTIPQAGRRGAPRIRRADLPRRARPAVSADGYDPTEDARRLMGRA
jgi:hypothetical protein